MDAIDEDSNAKVRFGAKSEFVRSLDRAIPAADVVALAERQGMKLTTGFVYNIRSAANGRANLRGHGLARKRKSPGTVEGAEAILRSAIAQIGLVKARVILEEVEAAFAGR